MCKEAIAWQLLGTNIRFTSRVTSRRPSPREVLLHTTSDHPHALSFRRPLHAHHNQATATSKQNPRLKVKMKTDNYLSLCLEQAAKSPLHYRHGAIVVRGGKVIGHGHNDYRPGFNGGALKSGRIAHGGYDGAAIAELKKKLKGKQKCDKPEKQQQNQVDRSSTFVPFESTNSGGGHSVNQPLSMHSEMMAIYSALNASSAMSSTTFSREKPCFKLPCADKRKARLRRNVLEAYVKAVCQTSAGTGKLQVQECGFETSASQPGALGEQMQQQHAQGGRQGRPVRPELSQFECGVSRGSGCSETSSEPEEREEEEWEEEPVPVRVSVRRVWTETAGLCPATAICV